MILSGLALLLYAYVCLCARACVIVYVYPPFSAFFLWTPYYAKDILDTASFTTIPNLQKRNLSLRECV